MCDTESTTITVQFGRASKQLEVVQRPIPHIIVDSSKELHGWWNGLEPYGNRECTAEKLLINPYNGCSHNCLFCYSHAFGGYFGLFRKHGVVTVFKEFDKRLERQLDGLTVASCGYLSPVTDPFQPLDDRYELSERIVKVFVDRNIPVQFTTKGKISETALNLIKKQEHSFGEISILTLDEAKRQRLMVGGAPTDELLRNIERLTSAGRFAVCRIDPIIPFVTDDPEELGDLVRRVADAGAKHIITSCLDVPLMMKHELYDELSRRFGVPKKHFTGLYTEQMSGRLHAKLAYRRKLFGMMRAICDRNKVTMSLCMEFESLGGKHVTGLNKEFMSSYSCEGIEVPLYVRAGDDKRFEPVPGCNGNCLRCHFTETTPICGILELKQAGAWRLKDYRRWSLQLKARNAEQRTFEV